MTGASLLWALAAGILTVCVAGAWAGPPGAARTPGRQDQDPASRPPDWFVQALRVLELSPDPGVAWTTAIGVGAVGLGWLSLRSPVLAAAVLAAVAAAGPTARALRGRFRGAGPSDRELLEAVAVVQAGVATGASLERAVARAAARPGTVGPELHVVVTAAARGVALADALTAWARRHPGTGVPLVVDALVIAGSTGADRGRALEAVARALRGREARSREIRALAAQAQLSAAVLVVMPLVFAGLVAMWDPAVARFTTGTPAGWACIVAGLALDAAGAAWMARLVGAVR